MRYHHARVVLAACLIAATAAAQAQSTPKSPEPQGKPNDAAALAARADGTAARGAPEMGSGLRTIDLADTYRLSGQDPDYTLRGLFQNAHGDFMNRRERYDPQIELRGRYLPDQRIKNEPGNFEMLGYDVDIELPTMVSTDGYLLFGGYYQGRSYTFSDSFGTAGNAQAMGDETLSGTGLTFGFGVFLDENVLFEAETNPGIWSDTDGGLHHKDYDFPSSALFTIRTLDNFFLKVGARYNQVYEDAPWLPYLGFSWELTESLRLDLLAPESVELSFWPSGSTGFLFGAEVTGAEYHVRTSAATGNQQDDVHVQEIVAYLGLSHRMSDYVSLMGRLGAVVAGDYDLTTGAAGYNRVEGTLEPGLFVEVTFGIDF